MALVTLHFSLVQFNFAAGLMVEINFLISFFLEQFKSARILLDNVGCNDPFGNFSGGRRSFLDCGCRCLDDHSSRLYIHHLLTGIGQHSDCIYSSTILDDAYNLTWGSYSSLFYHRGLDRRGERSESKLLRLRKGNERYTHPGNGDKKG